MNQQQNNVHPERAPESLDEAAGRAAAAMTTLVVDTLNRMPHDAKGFDPVTLQDIFITVFKQGASWGMDRAVHIATRRVLPANRRPL